QISEAIKLGEPFVQFDGNKFPATLETEKALRALTAIVRPDNVPPPPKEPDTGEDKHSDQQRVLIVEGNYGQTSYKRPVLERRAGSDSCPVALRSTLKKHQEDGLVWLRKSWTKGYSGVLLADDMGLGKTLQALTFLLWLREIPAKNLNSQQRGSILIIAPTGL